jgi:hypothetical protein
VPRERKVVAKSSIGGTATASGQYPSMDGGMTIRSAALIGGMMALSMQRGANAQTSEPKPVRGRPVMSWQRDMNGPAQPESRGLFARNDTTAPIVITRVLPAKCVNVSIECVPFTPDPRVLAPGQTTTLMRLSPARAGDSFSLAFELQWRTATECIGPRQPATAEPDDRKTAAPSAAQLIVPPFDAPDELHGKRVNVQFFVAENGTVDSVGIAGVSNKGFLGKVRKTMMGYRFNPALDRGCPVPGTTSMEITFT